MPRPRIDDLAYLAGLLLGLLMMTAYGHFAYRAEVIEVNDFSYVWAGARTVVDGGDPYDPAPFLATAARYGTAHPNEPVYGYPPWVALALTPLAALPVARASDIWTFGGMALAALALRSLLRAYAPGLPAVHTLAGLALFGSQPGISAMWSGQWSFVLVAGLSASIVALPRRGVLGQLPTLALLGKPHLVLFDVWALVRAAFARRGLAFAAAFVGMLAVTVAVPWLVFPDWLQAWITKLIPARYALIPPTTMANALYDLFGNAGAYLGALLLFAAVAIALAFDPRSDAALAVWSALSATFAPYGWSYDHLLLIVPLVLTAGIVTRRSIRAGLAVAIVGFVFFLLVPALLYIIATIRERESFNAFVPFVVLALAITALWTSRRASPIGGSVAAEARA